MRHPHPSSTRDVSAPLGRDGRGAVVPFVCALPLGSRTRPSGRARTGQVAVPASAPSSRGAHCAKSAETYQAAWGLHLLRRGSCLIIIPLSCPPPPCTGRGGGGLGCALALSSHERVEMGGCPPLVWVTRGHTECAVRQGPIFGRWRFRQSRSQSGQGRVFGEGGVSAGSIVAAGLAHVHQHGQAGHSVFIGAGMGPISIRAFLVLAT